MKITIEITSGKYRNNMTADLEPTTIKQLKENFDVDAVKEMSKVLLSQLEISIPKFLEKVIKGE